MQIHPRLLTPGLIILNPEDKIIIEINEETQPRINQLILPFLDRKKESA